MNRLKKELFSIVVSLRMNRVMSPLDASSPSMCEDRSGVSGGGNAMGSINDGPSHDEILIQYLILNPCLWDKSNSGFRNRSLKDAKWKEIATKIRMSGEFTLAMAKLIC